MKTSITYNLLRYVSEAYIKKDEKANSIWYIRVYRRRELQAEFLLEILKEREQLEDMRVAGKIILKRMLQQ
jgi:hypothetical protein